MINNTEVKPLMERIPLILGKIQDYDDFYCHNEEILDIYEGNLLPYVEKLMCETLDKRYFEQIKHRLLPINFVQKVTDKLAKSYAEAPIRMAEDQDFIDKMVDMLDIDEAMMLSEEYSYLNRGYALKPKLTNKGKIKLTSIPYDKFLVLAEDESDRLEPTIFVEFMGLTERQIIQDTDVVRSRDERVTKDINWYIAYTDTEILAFDEQGTIMPEITESIANKNPIGMIPFVYGNRSVSNIVPKQDTDFLKLAKVLPLMLSDINGAIMFQCFTLIYGIDIEFKDAKLNPNAIWELESKRGGDTNGSVGTLQPSVDSDKALNWFKNILAMWLDSKGIDAGSITKLDSSNIASGLSKAMDELDTTEARKKSIKKLQKEEKQLFKLLAKMNNYWLKLPEARDLKLTTVDENKLEESLTIEFKEPMAKLDYTTEIQNSINMLQNGLSYREKEIKRLHPYASDDEINQIFNEFGVERTEIGAEPEDQGEENGRNRDQGNENIEEESQQESEQEISREDGEQERDS